MCVNLKQQKKNVLLLLLLALNKHMGCVNAFMIGYVTTTVLCMLPDIPRTAFTVSCFVARIACSLGEYGE